MATHTAEQIERVRRALQLDKVDPVGWVKRTTGKEMWRLQRAAAELLRDNDRVAIASCHGIGKSWLAGRLATWFSYTRRNSLVVTTAPTKRQVEQVLWKEIAVCHRESAEHGRVTGMANGLGGVPLTTALKHAPDWQMLGFTAPDYDPDKFVGLHAEDVLVVVDEAGAISDGIAEGVEALLTTAGAKLLYIGNPTMGTGPFAKAFEPNSGFKTLRIPAFLTPNFTTFGIVEEDLVGGDDAAWRRKVDGRPMPMPHLITPAWAADKLKRWGQQSPSFRSRVCAEFPEADADDIIVPKAWIVAANRRWEELANDPAAMTKARTAINGSSSVAIGVDVARFGGAWTVIATRRGNVFAPLRKAQKRDAMTTANATLAHRAELERNLPKGHGISTRIDGDGVGGPVVDRVREVLRATMEPQRLDNELHEFRGGMPAMDSAHFVDRRSEAYWSLREWLDPSLEGPRLALPVDNELFDQLSGIKWSLKSRGRIALESKEEMVQRGQPSPDEADAVAMACVPVPTKSTLTWR